MKIGLYFGTFNPVHVGHLIIANHIVEHSDLDEIWMVVTPHNPFKKKATLLDNHHRYEMVYLATEAYPKLKPSDIEFQLPQPSYTATTLAYLEEKHPNYSFSLIMGEDNLLGLHKWKNSEHIVDNYDIYVYPRLQAVKEKPQVPATRIHKIDAPVIEISSTAIRNGVQSQKNVQPLLSQKVWEYIDSMNFYKS